MASISDIKDFFMKAKMDHKRLESKLFKTREKVLEIQNLLEENEALQAFLHEQIGGADE